MRVLTAVLTLALIGLGVWRFSSKRFKRLKLASHVAEVAGEASVDQDESGSGPRNLWYDKCAIVFVHQTNHLEVAKACQEYWKIKQHKQLLLVDAEGDFMNPGEYELIPAHNGYVRIIGAHEF